jgi:ribosomal protein S18 acetylase RimI-like enzyme
MADELAGAFAFMARGDMAGTSTEPSAYGMAVRCRELPLRQDSNYLLVDRTDASAAELAKEKERLALRAIVVRDETTGRRLEPAFESLGWKRHRGLVMAHHRESERDADAGLVTEVNEATLRSVRRQTILSYPWGTLELVEQLLDAKLAISGLLETHFLAVLVDGEVAAYADLYLGDGTAQIEDVATLEEYRNRGFASALVLHGLEHARRAGATFVFLVADADDWPKQLYERLGFDPIGRYSKFFT